MNKIIKVEYGLNSFLSICPNEEYNILKEKVKQFILLIENLDILKTVSIIDDKHLEKLNQISHQDVQPYSYGRKRISDEGTLIEIQGSPLKMMVGNGSQGLQVKDISQD